MRITDRRRYYLAGFVAVTTFLVYLASLQNDFIAEWDDGEYVLNNPHIRSINPAFLRWAFFDFYASNWHPLTWMSHALDYAIWGLNPLGHHLTSIMLHAINAFLVVVLIMRLQEIAKGTAPGGLESSLPDERGMLITAGVTGLLFGLHPVHVESVAWVAERKDLLCALFFLLSIMAYLRYAGSREPGARSQESESSMDDEGTPPDPGGEKRWYTFSLGLFVLALMSKPMAVSLPVVLLILDWYPFRRLHSGPTARTALVEKLPFITLSLISSVLTVLAQRAWGAIVEIQMIPLSSRLLVAAHSLLVYLWKMAVPWDLVPYYPYPRNISLASLEFPFAAALVIGITIFCIMVAKRHKLGLTAWGYYVVTLLPVIGIVQVGHQSMADRYTYLPSPAPFLVMGSLIALIRQYLKTLKKWTLIGGNVCAVVAIFTVFSLSYLTYKQIGIWRSSLSLWSYVIEMESTEVPIAYLHRGLAFGKLGQFENAIKDYDMAIALNSSYYQAYNNRGVVLEKLGQFENAIKDYNMAIALNSSYYQAYNNRGMVLEKLGQLENAIKDYNMAITLNPSNYEAYDNLGVLYGNAGLIDKAIETFNKSLAVNQNYYNAYNNRGLLYFSLGQYERALNDFNKTLELEPYFGEAYLNRGNLLFIIGKKEHALADLRRACDLGKESACKALRMAPE
jgi:tetratricopeptide (TPR) repeat protein